MGVLDGRVAIVTGAGRGIGRAEALTLAEHGARVVVNDLGGSLLGAGADTGPAQEVAEEIRAAGGEAVANTDDVADWAGAERLVRQAIDTFGRLDVLVNNAGVIRTGMSFNLSEADWDTVIRVHLKGTFATCRFAGAWWREESKRTARPVHGAIVNTSSPNGLNGGTPGHVNYAVAKAGIATMTITLARELAPYGVRCNAIAPLAVTRMTEELWATDMFRDRMDELDPRGVAAVVTWLASPGAESVSGQVLAVHGRECHLWEGWRTVATASTGGGPWTVEALDAARDTLFADRSSWFSSSGG